MRTFVEIAIQQAREYLRARGHRDFHLREAILVQGGEVIIRVNNPTTALRVVDSRRGVSEIMLAAA